MGIEYERKFKLNFPTFLAVNSAFPHKTREILMDTTYYDTPSGALSSRHYTLRQRLENDKSVCALKTPAGDARNEWETENASIEEAIPQLIALGAPAELQELAKEGLIPICGAKFTRLAKTLTLTHCTVELALDNGILTGGGKEISLCEVEVELKAGSEAAATDFAHEFAAQFGLLPEKKSKFKRALSLSRGD